jgi:AGZA family xanthine/uracil permease-like MFS transporter
MSQRPRWAGPGDVNAFFSLMLDNVVNLALFAGILLGMGFPAWIIFGKMVPGTALGVMIGDLAYTWMAFRLAEKTGREVTAMPLGLDSPSIFGMAFAVLVPAFSVAKAGGMSPDDAGLHAWHVGMAVMVLIGLLKVVLSFFGGLVQRLVPAAGLLGSLAGIAIALMGTLQFGELLLEPIAGFAALGVIWYSLVSGIKLPFKVPEVAVSVGLGTALYYAVGMAGLGPTLPDLSKIEFVVGLPLPSLGFLAGMGEALSTYLPVAVPFGLLTVIGGINVTESARLAGDDYDTRQILLVEAFATLIAGICGGVVQSTPYIGHPAYKAMGGRSAYTLATGLFFGIGGMLGVVPLLAQLLPKPALIPILLFVAVDITAQAFHATPKRHGMATAFAMIPNIAQLLVIVLKSVAFGLMFSAIDPEGTIAKGTWREDTVHTMGVMVMLGQGFILTGMLWGGALAHLADRRLYPAVGLILACAVLTLFGVIHSIDPSGGVYLPWTLTSALPWKWAAGYGVVALTFLILGQSREFKEAPAEHP